MVKNDEIQLDYENVRPNAVFKQKIEKGDKFMKKLYKVKIFINIKK